MNNWKKFSKNRLYLEHEDGFIIIKPENAKETIPLECPLCSFIMSDPDDIFYYKMYSVCCNCSIRFAEMNKDKWLNDLWRPNKEDVLRDKERRLSIPLRIKMI